MNSTFLQAAAQNFLGKSPNWYKLCILGFLLINPPLLLLLGPVTLGWILLAQFIFTLVMALKCYPLQPGGLLVLEAIALGMASPGAVYHELENNLEVLLLLIFMVASVYFMRELISYVFTEILVRVRNKTVLSVMFCFGAAFLSALLDALTVTAMLISICAAFYGVYNRYAIESGTVDQTPEPQDLVQFKAFLRNLIMHGAIGTALGGVCTLVGEPQNLFIATKMGWDFVEFFVKMAPVTMPVLVAGLCTCVLLERLRWFGYGAQLPESVYVLLKAHVTEQRSSRSERERVALIAQAIIGVILALALVTHVAAIGLIGLSVMVLLTAFNGVVEEHKLGHAFEEALPFTALLTVFFAMVAIIHAQSLFDPIGHYLLALKESVQVPVYFLATGVLSMISDNVFVATVYMEELYKVKDNLSLEQFEHLAVAINTGTNLPSVATPNGQAPFLFLLTSALAPVIRLSYGTMVWMALPYTIVLISVALLAFKFLLI